MCAKARPVPFLAMARFCLYLLLSVPVWELFPLQRGGCKRTELYTPRACYGCGTPWVKENYPFCTSSPSTPYPSPHLRLQTSAQPVLHQ